MRKHYSRKYNKGDRFGDLEVMDDYYYYPNKFANKIYLKCKCNKCGRIVIVNAYRISKKTDCGCDSRSKCRLFDDFIKNHPEVIKLKKR